MKESGLILSKGDWIRFQLKVERIVHEGFIQEISPDKMQLRIGKAPDSPDAHWYSLGEMDLLQHEPR